MLSLLLSPGIEKVGPAQDLVVSSSQVIPKTTNTLDLGSAAVQFKNAWFDGTVDTDTLAVSGNTTMGGTLDVTSTITGNVTGNLTGDVTGGLEGDVTGNVTGNLTGDVTGDVTSTGTSTFSTVDVNGGNIDNTAIGVNNASTVTGTTITAFTEFVGNVTGKADTATAWHEARSLILTGDVTGTVSGIDGSGDINVTTTVEPNSVALGTDTTGDYVSSLVAGTGVTVSGDPSEGATPTISIGQIVGTTSDVTFNDMTASGNLTVAGNFTVAGTTTTVLSNDVNIEDRIITLNSDLVGQPSLDAGFVIERGTEDNVSFVWDETLDEWTTGGERLKASTFEGALDGNATTASTATALATSRTIAGQSFDGTADISIAPEDLTDVTASAAALNTASTHYVPTGGIIMWSGTIANIPSGWTLCDGIDHGEQEVPDLRNLFIVGAGSTYDVGDTGGESTVTLSTAEMPSHNHPASSSSSSSVSDPGHQHRQNMGGVDAATGGTQWTAYNGGLGANGYLNDSSTTGISVSTSTSTSIQNTGGGGAHENKPPYYALAYIMKL